MITFDEVKVGLNTFWHNHPELIAMWIFGSVATGRQRQTSDVDIGILFQNPPSLIELGGIVSEITGALRRDDIDVITMNQAAPFLVCRIARDGIVLYDRDPVARVRFIAGARSVYFDFATTMRFMHAR